MRLEGATLFLVFMLALAYGTLVDVGLLVRIFRYRLAVVVACILAAVVIVLLAGAAASSGERAGFFKVFSGGSGLVVLIVTSAVFLPFIAVAPLAQYLSMRHGRIWPRWIPACMLLQIGLLPVFVILAFTNQYFWQREYAAAHAEGRQARAGDLGALLGRAEQRQERIWGTGWTYPRPQQRPPGSFEPSAWISGLALGIDGSALISANEPLAPPDRAALHTLMQGHFAGFAVPNIRAKLVWDALEPGRFSRQLAPKGVDDAGALGEEAIPVLLDRLEKHGAARLCPGGRMTDADRAALNALVVAKGRTWNVATRAYEMRPDWEGYPTRVERLCAAR